MTPDWREVAFRLFGYEMGAWFWIANSQSVNSRTGLRWDQKPGSHPFVLIAPYDGGPTAVTRPRSAHGRRGIHHQAHPPDCSKSCKIRQEGWIQHVLWTLSGQVICLDNHSCNEPYEEILRKLRSGARK